MAGTDTAQASPFELQQPLLDSFVALTKQIEDKIHLFATEGGDERLSQVALDVTKQLFDLGKWYRCYPVLITDVDSKRGESNGLKRDLQESGWKNTRTRIFSLSSLLSPNRPVSPSAPRPRKASKRKSQRPPSPRISCPTRPYRN